MRQFKMQYHSNVAENTNIIHILRTTQTIMIKGINQSLQEHLLKTNKNMNSKLSNFRAKKENVIEMLTAMGSTAIEEEIANQPNPDVGDFISEWNQKDKSHQEVRPFLVNGNSAVYVIEAFNLSGNNEGYQRLTANQQKIQNRKLDEERRSSSTGERRYFRVENRSPGFYQAQPIQSGFRQDYNKISSESYRGSYRRPKDNYYNTYGHHHHHY